jgi:hypothetical protein
VKSISKAWSEKDLDKLKGLIGSGVSALRVSVALKRSRAVVKQKARELGISFPTEAQLRAKRRQIFSNSTDGSPHLSARFGSRVSPRIF